MGGAIARGVVRSGLIPPTSVMVFDPDTKKAGQLKRSLGIRSAKSTAEVATFADCIILAVKPPLVELVLDEIKSMVTPEKCIVSIAAGIHIAKIEKKLPKNPVMRVMPNQPCLIGAGVSAFSAGRNAKKEHIDIVQKIFNALGVAVAVPEKHINGVTGLSGSGPAYVYEFIAGLIQGTSGVLPRELARDLATQTVIGAGKLAKDFRGKTLENLVDMVASPKGTTVAGLQVMSKNKLRWIVAGAVRAAIRRAEDLSKS